MLLLRPAWVWTSTVVMRRELAEKVGEFDESLHLGQDTSIGCDARARPLYYASPVCSPSTASTPTTQPADRGVATLS